MTIWSLILIEAFILTGGSAFIYMVVHVRPAKQAKRTAGDFQVAAEEDVEHIFNNEFREELRNRGRLHFEKILGENAMFLQQDLRLTTAQLNDYMKQQISKDLKDAFSTYESAVNDAKQLAIESIEKTKSTIDEQRQVLTAQLAKEVSEEKTKQLRRFDENMADIVNHYVLAAVGSEIDLNDQLEYILGELETHKQAILEDVINGA